MKSINCDVNAECVEFGESVNTTCFGAILLEDAHEWGLMREALRKVNIMLRQTPEDQELRFFIEKVYNGLGVFM